MNTPATIVSRVSAAAEKAAPVIAGHNDRSLLRIGTETFGPIFAEFALRLHAYLGSVPQPETVRLLFCARGGLRLHLVYRRFLEQTGLMPPVGVDDIMISRIVAARGAVLARSPDAFEEIAREFAGGTMRDICSALAGEPVQGENFGLSSSMLDAAFDARRLPELISDGASLLTPLGRAVRDQNNRFLAHLAAQSRGARRVILCDTGLYGSTIRMLQHGVPDVSWTSVLFARSNYKGFDEAHFARTIGLSVERNGYSPFDRHTAALRYWQLVEDLLEPPLPSVRRFDDAPGGVVSNLERGDWRSQVGPLPGTLFAGVMDYVAALSPEDYAQAIRRDAALAWRNLHRLVVWPRSEEAALLLVGERSRDFGRTETVAGLAPSTAGGLGQDIAAVRQSLWREGAAAQRFPKMRLVLQAALQAFYTLRFLRSLKL